MMEKTATPLAGVYRILSEVKADGRGYFYRAFCSEEWKSAGLTERILQTNISHNHHRGTVRGMHLQLRPSCESRLVRCIRGRVYDVAVDLRRASPTFLQYFGCELIGDRGDGLWIPEGFAHGYQVLEDESTLLYHHTGMYDRDSEFTLAYNEPRVNVRWPLPVGIVSDKDREAFFLDETFEGVDI